MSIRPADALGSLAAATTLASDDRASWRTISRPIPLREGDPKRRQSRLAEAETFEGRTHREEPETKNTVGEADMEGTRASVCLGVGGEMGSGRVDLFPPPPQVSQGPLYHSCSRNRSRERDVQVDRYLRLRKRVQKSTSPDQLKPPEPTGLLPHFHPLQGSPDRLAHIVGSESVLLDERLGLREVLG